MSDYLEDQGEFPDVAQNIAAWRRHTFWWCPCGAFNVDRSDCRRCEQERPSAAIAHDERDDDRHDHDHDDERAT